MKTKKIAPVKKALTRVATVMQKVARKKVSTPKTKKPLVHTKLEESFWVNDGRILSNLIELKDALESMDESIFAHHVSKEKNDFADWIEHVLEDVELASTLRKSKKPRTAHAVVASRLQLYII